MIDSHFSDFYLNKDLQFIIKKINDQVDILKEETLLIQESKILFQCKWNKCLLEPKHQKSMEKDQNPPEFSIETLYF